MEVTIHPTPDDDRDLTPEEIEDLVTRGKAKRVPTLGLMDVLERAGFVPP